MSIKKLTLEEACELTGNTMADILPWPNPTTPRQVAYNTLSGLEILIEAYNMVDGKKWVSDYSDDNQPKYRFWLEWDSAVSAFVFHDTFNGYSFAYTATGSRHDCRTREIAEFVATEHLDEWNKWHIKK